MLSIYYCGIHIAEVNYETFILLWFIPFCADLCGVLLRTGRTVCVLEHSHWDVQPDRDIDRYDVWRVGYARGKCTGPGTCTHYK